MDQLTLWMAVGFLFAAYSVIANDSVQTLWYGWHINGGDIAYERLTKIPFQEIQWYHAVAPAILLCLTRVGVPVSTSFLVLSAFASTFVLENAPTTAHIIYLSLYDLLVFLLFLVLLVQIYN